MFLVHIMLILADTDGLRIDLYKLRKRVLETACDGDGTSLSHVEFREFLCGKLAGRIYGSSRLIYDHVLDVFRDLLDKLRDDLLRLSGSSSVSDGDQGDLVFLDELL